MIKGILCMGVSIAHAMVWMMLGAAPAPGVDGTVFALAADTAGVYAGGSFAAASEVPAANIALWDGTRWCALGGGVDGPVRAIAIDNGEVFAGGQFQHAGGVAVNNLARWNGAAWSDVGGGVGGTPAVVKSLAFDGAGLLAGGIFSQVGASTPANGIARWTGSAWNILGGLPPNIQHDIRTILPLDGTIYAGGVLLFPGTTRPSEGTLLRATPAVLSDHAGSANADDECTGCASVDALATDGSSLFVAGAFTRLGESVLAGSPYMVVELLNATIPVGLGDGPTLPTVAGGGVIGAVAVDGGDLYVGGNVGQIRGVLVARVARWNGTSWSALGVGVDAPVHALAIWNDAVFAGGEFVTAGGTTVNHIARWEDGVWSPLESTTTPVQRRSWGALKGTFRERP